MAETPNANVTEILKAAQQGDQDAAGRLLPHMYDELRKLARAEMARLAPRDPFPSWGRLPFFWSGGIVRLYSQPRGREFDHDPICRRLSQISRRRAAPATVGRGRRG